MTAHQSTGLKVRNLSAFCMIPRAFCFPDLIAIPDMGGAMENWGLVTFRESAVLFDSSTGSVADKKLVTMILDHELAHQVKSSST